MVDLAFKQPAHPQTWLREVPPLLIRIAALGNPALRELLEMRDQLAQPFIGSPTSPGSLRDSSSDSAASADAAEYE